MIEASDIRFARAGDASIAYRVLGDGPTDLLVLMGAYIPIDAMLEEPSLERFLRRLTGFSRVVLVNPRGVGLSDPMTDAAEYPERHREDVLAVIDDLGSRRVSLLATEWGAQVAVMLGALDSERIASMILYHGFPKSLRDDDYPYGWDPDAYDLMEQAIADRSLSASGQVQVIAPSAAADPEFIAWVDRVVRRGASPSAVRALFDTGRRADVTSYLPRVAVPTLVVHRVDNQFVEVGHSRLMAERIPDARYVELPGADHVLSIGDADAVLGEIEEFLTGVRRSRDSERRLATVLISDIVGSTERAARLGDAGWRALLDAHDRVSHDLVQREGGTVVKSTGDGVLAIFDGPSPAIRCARGMVERLRRNGLELRCGIHTGEIEFRGDDVGGVGVHLTARVAGAAAPCEVLVSSAVPPLMIGSGIAFETRGTHELKGVQGAWQLFAVNDDELGSTKP